MPFSFAVSDKKNSNIERNIAHAFSVSINFQNKYKQLKTRHKQSNSSRPLILATTSVCTGCIAKSNAEKKASQLFLRINFSKNKNIKITMIYDFQKLLLDIFIKNKVHGKLLFESFVLQDKLKIISIRFSKRENEFIIHYKSTQLNVIESQKINLDFEDISEINVFEILINLLIYVEQKKYILA